MELVKLMLSLLLDLLMLNQRIQTFMLKSKDLMVMQKQIMRLMVKTQHLLNQKVFQTLEKFQSQPQMRNQELMKVHFGKQNITKKWKKKRLKRRKKKIESMHFKLNKSKKLIMIINKLFKKKLS